MASPLKMFRKNRKVWLAVVTILAMFGFVFIGPWSKLGDPAHNIQNPEVFTWKFGVVRDSDLQNQLHLRNLVARFLIQAALAAGQPEQQIAARVNAYFPTTEQGIVEAMLLAHKAQQMGIVVSDTTINKFLQQWTQDRVRGDQLARIIAAMRSERSRLSEAQLFEALRFELSGLYVRAIFSPLFSPGIGYQGSFGGDPPADRWEAFCRLNRKVTVQLAPVAVESFASEIPNPPDDTLRTFYEQYKGAMPVPDSPTPGFRQPFKAQFEHFKADYEKFVAAEMPKVTDEEIKAYYEQYKDVFFRKTQLPDQGIESSIDKLGPAEPEKPGDAKSVAPDASQAPDPGKASQGKAPESKAKAPDAGKAPDGKESDKTKSSTDGKQSRAAPRPNSLDGELLALADQPATQTPDTKTPDIKTPDIKAPDIKAPEAKTQDTQPPAAAIPKIEYEPLDKVADTIRNRVAAEKFDKRNNEAFVAIRTVMDDFRNEMARYRADIASGITSAKPPPVDLAPLAEKYGLEFKKTELITREQALRAGGIGRSVRLTPGSYTATPFVQLAFQPSLPLYLAEETDDVENNRYLWWKIADEAAHTPPLAEIKDQVVQAWKLIQARTPAKEKAEQLAAQARNAKQSLKDAFGKVQGLTVMTSGPFSWLTRPVGDPIARPQLMDISGVEDAGDEFMKAVFDLGVQQTGVAPNKPQTIYYVVQIEAEEPPLDELRESFMAAMSSGTTSRIYAVISGLNRQDANLQWIKELEDQYDFRLAPDRTLSQTNAVE